MIETTIYLGSGLVLVFFLVVGLLVLLDIQAKEPDCCHLCGSGVYWYGHQWFCENPGCQRFSSPMVE